MKCQITIIIDQDSWLNQYLDSFVRQSKPYTAAISIVHQPSQIKKGDILFILSFSQIIPAQILELNRHNLVVHESALPHGKGWSPVTWQILQNQNQIPVTIFEAAPKVDSGQIYLQTTMSLQGNEVLAEVHQIQAENTIKLCLQFLSQYPGVLSQARPQRGRSSYFRKRQGSDSELNINKTLKSQFNLLRIVDNDKYPAFFRYRGHKYILKISKGQ